MSGYIVGISKPSNTESKIELIEGLVLDVELLDRILKCLSLLSNVCRPKNRQEHRSGNKKSLQQSSILKSLATWGKGDGITKLVKRMLDGSGSVSLGEGGGDFPEESVSGPWGFERGGRWSATATDLLKAITSVVNLWLAGRCPPILAEFVASAPLTSLMKPENGIRPIAYLSDFQFGVGVSGGAEAVLHSANRLLSEYHNDGYLAMLTKDFSNAVSGPGLGLELNIKKTEIFWLSCNGVKLREGLFLVDIRLPFLGVKLLGGAVNRDADFISEMAMRRAANAVDLMNLLP
ncbi:hypothetical protein Tco_0678440 [Tanacetum coccineum]|uniref:Reverse transcriptase domain-containing protein n=1 Tax=Tanacetum coccineum TaxID=301880 RepID=A0ABQ4XFA1_9ASTR